MYAHLKTIDLLSGAPGQRVGVQTDHRDAEEMGLEPELSVLFALSRVLNPLRAERNRPDRVVYRCAHPPIDEVRAAVAAAGGQLEVAGAIVPRTGPKADLEALADRAFQGLAARVLAREKAPLSLNLMRTLEEETVADGLLEGEDPAGYWARILELAALGGELIRARGTGGRWTRSDRLRGVGELGTVPFLFEAGVSKVNLCGKGENLVDYGLANRPSALIGIVRDKPELLPSANWLPMFKPPGYEPPLPLATRPLLSNMAPHVRLPSIVLCHDRPDSVGYPGLADIEDVAGAWTEAAANLAKIKLQEHPMEIGGVKILGLGGHWFAAEKVLDEAFMRSLHVRMNSPTLFAGIPHRTVLFVAPLGANANLTSLQMLALCAGRYDDPGEQGPICRWPLVIVGGRVTGVLDATPKAPPKPAPWSKPVGEA